MISAFTATLVTFQSAALAEFPLPAQCSQVLQVTTDEWTSSSGTAQRFERSRNRWNPVGDSIVVKIGKKGLAWGNGLVSIAPQRPARIKKEGDGCSPAGIFRLSFAFGREANRPSKLRFPFRVTTPLDVWIDDAASPDYNTWQTLSKPGEDPLSRWKSFEWMQTKGPYYDLGVVVEHNTSPIIPGNGSAIFLHLWNDPSGTTAGCTSMSIEDLTTIVEWLDEKRMPLLVQLPFQWSFSKRLD